nr:unnamed protein product [Callosobruchus chinensis]
MIWHQHVSSILTDAGKKLGYLFRARKYFSPSNPLTLYKTQTRPSLYYYYYIWGAAALTTLSILDAVQWRAIRLIGDPALTCHHQPLSHHRAVGDLSLFYRNSDGFSSSELTSIIPPLSRPARYTRGTSSSHPKAVVLHTSRTERYDRTFVPRVSRAWNGLPRDVLVGSASVGLFKSRVNKPNLPLAAAVLWYLGLAFAVCSVIKEWSSLDNGVIYDLINMNIGQKVKLSRQYLGE